MLSENEKLDAAVRCIKDLMGDFTPVIALTLGSGLGYLADLLEDGDSTKYFEIPHCPVPSATSHAGRFCWGKLGGVPVIMLQGRVHLYEGFTPNEVVFLTRLVIKLGVKQLILTHATGAVTRNLEPGDIVGVRSQIALNCPDPTAGPGIPDLGIEFSPVEAVFSPKLLQLAKKCALKVGISFHFGVSAFKQGRTYESVAEIDAMARMGADVATMSTVPEVIAAAQMGAEVLDLALVTDMGSGLGSLVTVSHEEVLRVVELMKGVFGNLILSIVEEMGRH